MTTFMLLFTPVHFKNDEEGFMLTDEKLNCLNTFAEYLNSLNRNNISSFWKSIRDFDVEDNKS